MDLDIRGVNYELDDDLREFTERRLRFALGRFVSRTGRIEVRLFDVNGPRGGIDKRCQITVALRPRGAVRVEDTSDDPYRLVAHAAKRAGQAVYRTLGRRRHGASQVGLDPRFAEKQPTLSGR
jgi:ribosome-associated translation inhibitor RaiA